MPNSERRNTGQGDVLKNALNRVLTQAEKAGEHEIVWSVWLSVAEIESSLSGMSNRKIAEELVGMVTEEDKQHFDETGSVPGKLLHAVDIVSVLSLSDERIQEIMDTRGRFFKQFPGTSSDPPNESLKKIGEAISEELFHIDLLRQIRRKAEYKRPQFSLKEVAGYIEELAPHLYAPPYDGLFGVAIESSQYHITG